MGLVIKVSSTIGGAAIITEATTILHTAPSTGQAVRDLGLLFGGVAALCYGFYKAGRMDGHDVANNSVVEAPEPTRAQGIQQHPSV